MSNRLFGFISVEGELDRIERANQIFFHSYATLTFFVPFWLVTINGESNAFVRLTWQTAFFLLLAGATLIGRKTFRLILWAIPMAALLLTSLVAIFTRPENGNRSLPLTLITLSVVLYTSSTFKRWAAYVWIAVALLSEGLLLHFGREWFAARGAVVNSVPISVIFHAAVGALIWEALHRSRVQAATLDEALAELISFKSVIEDASERENDRRSRLQRIHSDILNTLIGIANWSIPATDELVESCKRALSNTLGIPPVQGGSLRALIDECLKKLNTKDFKIRLTSAENIILPQMSLLAIRAIIEECISNAVKHSQGSLISIGWRVSHGREIEIWVEDNGIGISEDFVARLGWGEVIAPAVKRLGGRASRANLQTSGCRITVIFPHSAVVGVETNAIHELRSTYEAQDNFQDHALGWASQLIAYILLALTPIYLWGVSGWQEPAIIAALLFGYLTVLLFLPKLHTFATNAGAVLLSCGLLLMASKSIDGCVNASGLQWIANISGVLFLSGLYRFGRKTFLIQFPLFTITSLYVGSSLPSTCVQLISIPLYGAGIYGIATASHSVANKRRRRVGEDALLQFTQISAVEERRLEQRVRDEERWQSLLVETRELFAQITTGSHISPEMRRSAALQDARLRAHLQVEALNQPRVFGVAGRLIDRIALQGLIPTLQFGTFGEEDIAATEADFTGPEELITQLTMDLKLMRGNALLHADRPSADTFTTRISGFSEGEMRGDLRLGNWRYKSTAARNSQATIEITFTTDPVLQ